VARSPTFETPSKTKIAAAGRQKTKQSTIKSSRTKRAVRR
jgi:hypothetical protein